MWYFVTYEDHRGAQHCSKGMTKENADLTQKIIQREFYRARIMSASSRPNNYWMPEGARL